jgi:hypothetical protein
MKIHRMDGPKTTMAASSSNSKIHPRWKISRFPDLQQQQEASFPANIARDLSSGLLALQNYMLPASGSILVARHCHTVLLGQ